MRLLILNGFFQVHFRGWKANLLRDHFLIDRLQIFIEEVLLKKLRRSLYTQGLFMGKDSCLNILLMLKGTKCIKFHGFIRVNAVEVRIFYVFTKALAIDVLLVK